MGFVMPMNQQLSARWTHPERDGILTDRIIKGDISSWSRATSKPFGSQFKPVRPEVGRVRAAFTPVTSLKECAVYEEVKKELAKRKTHDPNSVVLPFAGERKQDPCDIKKTFALQKSYWKLMGYKNMDVRPKA